MKENKSNRTRLIGIRVSQQEYERLQEKFKASTCRKLSEYVRACVFSKPIVSTYRNVSLDEFMQQTILLRTELNAIGNNFNQAVKKLHSLSKIDEFRAWLIAHEVEKKTLFNKLDEIKINIRKVAELWLQ